MKFYTSFAFLLPLVFLFLLIYPITTHLQYEEINRANLQNTLTYDSHRFISNAFPENNPDESILDITFEIPTLNSNQDIYGKYELNLCKIFVTIGGNLPFRVISNPPGLVDLGILNKINTTFVIYLVFSDDIPIKFQNSFTFDKNTLQLSQNLITTWKPLDPFGKPLLETRYKVGFDLYFSVLREFNYENETVMSYSGSPEIVWVKNGSYLEPFLESIEISENTPEIVAIWPNEGALYLNYFIVIFPVAVSTLIYFFYYKRKVRKN
jgi:hypothetical protein